MTEKDIQNGLYFIFSKRHHKLIVPNVNLFGFECDLITITNAEYVHEYEIKISKYDFKSDFKKRHKHLRMKNCIRCPNYFWYVVPEGLIDIEDVPVYAGLIYIKKIIVGCIVKGVRTIGEKFVIDVKRNAPCLHKLKLTTRERDYLERGLMYRYWSYRTKGE